MAFVMTIGLVLGYAWSVVLLHRQRRHGLQPGSGVVPAGGRVTALRPRAVVAARTLTSPVGMRRRA